MSGQRGIDADPGPWDLCVVAAMDKFTQITESGEEEGGHGHSLKGRSP